MRSFTSDEVSLVSAKLKAHGVGQELERPFPSIQCPVCHHGAILRYRYLRPRGTSGNALFGYIWCSHCMRYVGTMSAVPDWWGGEDVLTQEEHEQFEQDDIEGLERMFRHVETLDNAIG